MMDVVNRLAEAWWGWMGPMLWQASLLIVVVGAIDLLVRRWAWPQVRHALWLLVVVKLVLPPAWSLPSGLVPRFESQLAARVALPWRAAERPAEAGGLAGEPGGTASPAEPGAARPGAPSSGAPPRSGGGAPVRAGTPWPLVAFAVWLLGALAFVLVLAARLTGLRRWHDKERRGQTIPPWYHELLVKSAQRLGVHRLPAILFSDKLLTPAVCGVWRPVMYLPRDYLDSLTPDEAEHVLLHELAHLKRGDLWAHGLDLLLQVVYWFNPLVALARRRLQHTRELCTDLAVAETLREGTAGYRLTLLNTARRMLTESAAPGLGLLGVFEEPFRLVSRLRWLEKPTWERRAAARAAAAAVALAMIVFVLPMAGGAPSLDGLPAADAGLAGGGEPAGGAASVGEAGAPAVAPARMAAGTPPGAPGEVLYIRNLTRQERILLDMRVSDEPLGGGETWLGDGAVTVHEGGRTTIVNLRDNTLTYVNHDDRSYVVTPLPLDLEAALDPEVRAWLRSRATTGRVRETGRVRQVLDRPCREFEVESWGVGVERGGKPVTFMVLACNDVPGDVAAFRVFLNCLRQLHGREESYCRDLLQVDGIQMRLVRVENRFPFRIRTVDEVVEMERRPAPADLFAPPREYERKERIERL
jgi:beta-lactamase regulating signal transducer with metallopeptidase domain